MDGINNCIDEAFQLAGKDSRQLLKAVAEYLEKSTDFFSTDYKKIVSSIFIPTWGSRNDSALQTSSSTNFDGSIDAKYKKPSEGHNGVQKIYAPETQFDDNPCDLEGDASNDSIIPETQCDLDISNDDDISFQTLDGPSKTSHTKLIEQNMANYVSKIDFNASTSTEKSLKIIENNQSQKHNDSDESDADYICIASDSTQTQILQSQAILANADDCLNSYSSGNGISPRKTDRSEKTADDSTISNSETVDKLVAARSSSVTPDLDLAALDAESEQKSNKSLDDSDFFDACTQQTVVRVPPKQIEGTSMSVDDDSFSAAKDKDEDNSAHSNDENDVYEAQTQVLKPIIKAKEDFIVPSVPKVNTPMQSRKLRNRTTKANIAMETESDDGIFDVATQRIQADEDIFAVATQQIVSDNTFDQATQTLPLTSSGKSTKGAATKKAVNFSTSVGNKSNNDESASLDDIYDQATQRVDAAASLPSGSNANRDSIYDQDTQKIDGTSEETKTPQKLPPLQWKHKQIPNTPEWSAVKDITAEDIRDYEQKVADKNQRSKKSPWMFVDSSDEDNDDAGDIIMDIEVRKLQVKPKESTTSANHIQVEPTHQKRAENGNGISKSIKNTGKLHDKNGKSDLEAEILTSAQMGKIIRRRCSVHLQRVPMVNDADKNKFSEIVTSSKSNNKKNDDKSKKSDDKSKSSPRAIKRPADNRDGPIQPKRTAKHVELPVEPRRLRDRNVSTTERNKRKNIVDNHQENDEEGTKGKRTRNKTVHVESNEIIPMRRATRQKTRDEAVEVMTASANINVSKQTRRSRKTAIEQTKPLNILVTKIDSAMSQQFTHMVKQLGGFLIDTPQIGDILICDKVYRTFKFLFAICKGIPIVRSTWLEMSHKNGKFQPTDPYLLTDYDAEKRFSFSLKKSIETARKTKLLANYLIFTTPHVQPVPDEIAEIVKHCGGEYSYSLQVTVKPNTRLVLLTSKKDRNRWQQYQNAFPHIEIVASEGFMQSIMQQKITFSHHLLDRPNT